MTNTLDRMRSIYGAEHPNAVPCLALPAEYLPFVRGFRSAEKIGLQLLAADSIFAAKPALTPADAQVQLRDLLPGAQICAERAVARQALDALRNKPDDEWTAPRQEPCSGPVLAAEKKYAEAEPLLLYGYRVQSAGREHIDFPERYHVDLATQMAVQL